MGWTIDHIPDQHGRVAVVTGANSGIGFETTKALADHGATVIMACRSERRAEEARERIREAVHGADLRIEALDLASLESISSFADRLAGDEVEIDLLINNAGIMAAPLRETADGFESQFGINHLGHFALSGQVIDRVRNGGRIVTVSSAVHENGEIHFDDLNWKQSYSRWGAYGQSKLANLLFAYELDRRLEAADRDVISLGAHPGYADTGLQARSAADSRLRSVFMKLANAIFAQSAAGGALPVLYAATAEDVSRRSYIAPDGFMNMRGSPTEQRSSAESHDRERARRLWDVSEELTGVEFELSRETDLDSTKAPA